MLEVFDEAKNRETLAAYLFLAPFIILFSIFVIRAVIMAIHMSFFDWTILKPIKPFIGLANYKELFQDDVWWLSLRNTIYFALMTVVGTSIIALMAALAINQIKHGKELFRVLLYMPSLLSVGVIGLTWVWLLNTQFGIINYVLSFIGIRPINWLGEGELVIPALSFTTMWWGFGFPMLIFIAGLQGIPEQLYEAARIDGARAANFLWDHLTLTKTHYFVCDCDWIHCPFSGLWSTFHHDQRRSRAGLLHSYSLSL